MATLTVLIFSQPDGAEKAVVKLHTLKQQQLIHINDAALVSWKWGRERPETCQTDLPQRLDTVDGAFWSLLFGLIFFAPLLGTAQISSDSFIQAVQAQVTEGTSALFTLTSEAVDDRIVAAFDDGTLEVITINLKAATEKSCCCKPEEVTV